MADEIAFENGRISNFQGLVTLTLGRVILHTVVHHSLTSTYMPNFTEIKETSCGRTYIKTDRHLRPTLLGRLRRVGLKSAHSQTHICSQRTQNQTSDGGRDCWFCP